MSASKAMVDAVREAEHLCPHQLPHLDKIRWKARYIENCFASAAASAPGWFLPLSMVNGIQAESIDRLIERAKHAHYTDVDMRINGKNEAHQADWIKHMRRLGEQS